MKIEVDTVYSRLEKISPRTLLHLSVSTKLTRGDGDGKNRTVQLQPRASEFDSSGPEFGALITTRSIKGGGTSLGSEINEFDCIVISGVTLLSNLHAAKRVSDLGFRGPIFFEAHEDDFKDGDTKAIDAVVRKVNEWSAPELLEGIVYLSKRRHGRKYVTPSIDPIPSKSIPVLKETKVKSLVDTPKRTKEPRRALTRTNRIIRDSRAARLLKEEYEFRCQICKKRISFKGRLYAEVHHLIPIGKPHAGKDEISNMLVVCPNHHAMFDLAIPYFGSERTVRIDGGDYEITTIPGHNLEPASIQHHNNRHRELYPED